jgi:hypothetical protein
MGLTRYEFGGRKRNLEQARAETRRAFFMPRRRVRKIAPDAVPVSRPHLAILRTLQAVREMSREMKPLASAKWLIFLGRACSRLLFSRFFRFFAEISKAAMRFR